MSSSQHPVALGLERQVGDATKLLATVMGLPLVDGIFPAMVLAGALDSTLGVLQIGLLVFGGSATVAVILAELDGHPRQHLASIALLGVGLAAVAGLEAALAPTIESLLVPETFERFAALVMFAIAAKTASSTIGEYLPRPAVIIGLGMVASFDPSHAELVLMLKPDLIARAAAAAGVGTLFALGVAFFGSTLRGALDIDRFRFGSAVALGMLPLAVLGEIPGNAPLAVLGVTALLAFEPGPDADDEAEPSASPAPSASPTRQSRPQEAATDGGLDDELGETPDEESSSNEGYGFPQAHEDSRKPWL